MVHLNEIIIVLVVVLILFGTGKFPKIMQNIAEGIKVFKKEVKDNKKTPSQKNVKKATKKTKK